MHHATIMFRGLDSDPLTVSDAPWFALVRLVMGSRSDRIAAFVDVRVAVNSSQIDFVRTSDMM